MQTPQANAITAAQQLASIMSAYVNLMSQINSWMTDYNQNNWDTYWQHMATVSINTDGSRAASNDGSPTNTNPLTLPVGSPILFTRNSLITAKALATTLQTLYSQAGGTLTVPNQAPQVTAAILAPNL